MLPWQHELPADPELAARLPAPVPSLMLFPVLLTDGTTFSNSPGICCTNRPYPILQPAEQHSACKSWRVPTQTHGQVSLKGKKTWPWDRFLQHSQRPALRTRSLEQPSSGAQLPGAWAGISLYQGWRLTHPPGSFPFSQGRQFLMQSWKFSTALLCDCSWGRGLCVDFWKAIRLITG